MKPQNSNNVPPPSASNNLKRSDEPQIIRSHHLQKMQRSSFIAQFQSVIKDFFPSLNQSTIKIALLSILADGYLTHATVIHNRRRLGQEYTYTTMFSEKDYQYQGTAVLYSRRYILSLMEILGRHVIWKLIGYLLHLKKTKQRGADKKGKENHESLSKVSKTLKDILNFNLQEAPLIVKLQTMEQYFFLMLFMLKWSPFYNFPQTILKIGHVYTFKNAKDNNINYKIEGYMLLIIFFVKVAKLCYKSYQKRQKIQSDEKINKKLKKKTSIEMNLQGLKKASKTQPVQLCRICYDQMQQKSATSCGHTFCWQCIIKTVEISQECPICRAVCLPRQCVQLQNF